MALEEANAQPADHEPRCEFAETLFTEGECQRLGEVQVDGSLLCVPHAELLRLKVREGTLLGTVFEMDKWLDNPNNRADELRWRRLLRERDEVVDQLRFNRMLLEAHEEAIQHR
jgi:hypothetical protein